uniref:Uncharacterized protein n=1 Tax=Acrobeloides nanus TaxID=290746 RepID=A0A914CUQ0_9BILA
MVNIRVLQAELRREPSRTATFSRADEPSRSKITGSESFSDPSRAVSRAATFSRADEPSRSKITGSTNSSEYDCRF